MNLLYRRNTMYPYQSWLTCATMQSIVGAFGQTDGKAVIKATNAYLNQLAASDMDKATALAALINEDPMMVCSLGLEVEGVTMPIRWLYGLGQIATGFIPTANTTFKDVIKPLSNPSWIVSSNVVSWANNTTGYIQQTNYIYWFNGGTGTTSGRGFYQTSNPIVGRRIVVEKLKTSYVYDGVSIPTGDGGNYNTSQLIARTNDRLYRERLEISEGGVMVRNLIPFIRKIDGVDKLGMIDVLSDTFYQNTNSSGEFLIAYTLQDGVTPWTPST